MAETTAQQWNTKTEADSTAQFGQLQGVYTLKDIDVITAGTIQGVKTKFLLNINNLEVSDARKQLSDLMSAMLDFIEKYFDKKTIEAQVVKIDQSPYDFYSLKSELQYVSNIETVRIVAENSFSIYNHFAKQIGIEIATTRVNPKKKL